MTKKRASGILSGLLCVQLLLTMAAIAAVLLKDRPSGRDASYLTAMTTADIAWR